MDHLFRQESGKMVSVLTKLFGYENFELAEDVVQSTLLAALETWKIGGVPDHPKAWLYRVAKNKAIDLLRRERYSETIDFSEDNRLLLKSEYTVSSSMDKIWQEDKIRDDFLAMMFACCHPKISSDNQVTFMLKILCGFSTKEIARAFLTTEEIISKRIYRTKEFYRKSKIKPTVPRGKGLNDSLSAVLSAIYLLFNEGYSSTHTDALVREELVSQAMFLTKELLSGERTNRSEVNALMALMCFHSARLNSRTNGEGRVVLLPDQDRSSWNQELILLGKSYLYYASEGGTVSNYHFEALIAHEHCVAKRYEETNWESILTFYDQMLSFKFDPVVYLNKCLVHFELYGAKDALNMLKKLNNNKQIKGYYLYYSILGKLYQEEGDNELARESFNRAILLSKSKKEQELLEEKIRALG